MPRFPSNYIIVLHLSMAARGPYIIPQKLKFSSPPPFTNTKRHLFPVLFVETRYHGRSKQ